MGDAAFVCCCFMAGALRSLSADRDAQLGSTGAPAVLQERPGTRTEGCDRGSFFQTHARRGSLSSLASCKFSTKEFELFKVKFYMEFLKIQESVHLVLPSISEIVAGGSTQ
jgi:hypothetical protein